MKQFLLTGLLATAVLSASAYAPDGELQATKEHKSSFHYVKGTDYAAPRKSARKLMRRVPTNKINPVMRAPQQSPVMKADASNALFESFEGWNGTDATWLPEGWSFESKGEIARADSWMPTKQTYYPAPVDGEVYFGNYLTFASDHMDEWLITPAVDVADGNVFEYYIYIEPIYIFSLDNMDWTTGEYEGGKKVALTLQIWAQPEGEEWTMLNDLADRYKDFNGFDLMSETPTSMVKNSIDVSSYAGKKVKFAFRYVGADGNVVFIDAVRVGMPSLEGTSYTNPFETLFWGYDTTLGTPGLMRQDIAIYPVYEPLSWYNQSDYTEGATYTWTYSHPETKEDATEEGDMLTVTYVPDYSSNTMKQNNFHVFPTLTAEAPNALPGTFTTKYFCLQAGGKPEMTFTSGDTFTGGILSYGINNDEDGYLVLDYEKYGDLTCPIFGHDEYTDRWWLEEYTLRGEEPAEGEYARLTGILNFIYPTTQSLVVNGVTVFGHGKMNADAELKIAIYALPETMEFYPEKDVPVASAICKGSEIFSEDARFRDDIYIPFTFDAPVVIKKTEDTPYYVVVLTGFNSDEVEFFAPLQSMKPHPDYLCHGWIIKEMNVEGRQGTSMSPIAYIEGEYGDCYNSFAIQLEAEYPWLATEAESIELPADGSATTVALGSYYDGSKLTVEAPAGVEASVAGRYDECVLTVRHKDTTTEAKGNVVVKGPGVELSIPLGKGAGIADIITDTNAEITGVYDLSGRRVNPADAKNGVYVVKYSDGTVRKAAIR